MLKLLTFNCNCTFPGLPKIFPNSSRKVPSRIAVLAIDFALYILTSVVLVEKIDAFDMVSCTFCVCEAEKVQCEQRSAENLRPEIPLNRFLGNYS